MPVGTVRWFSLEKGYGFIARDDDEDVYVHYSSIAMDGFKALEAGTRVEFEVGKDDKGPVADNVRPLESISR